MARRSKFTLPTCELEQLSDITQQRQQPWSPNPYFLLILLASCALIALENFGWETDVVSRTQNGILKNS